MVLGLAISVLNSCGQPVCVAGFGQCAAPEKPITTASPTNEELKLAFDKTEISVSQTAKLTISGGTPPYRVAFFGGLVGGTLDGDSGQLSNATTYTYTANVTGTFTFEVTDSSKPAAKTARTPIVVTSSR